MICPFRAEVWSLNRCGEPCEMVAEVFGSATHVIAHQIVNAVFPNLIFPADPCDGYQINLAIVGPAGRESEPPQRVTNELTRILRSEDQTTRRIRES